MTSHTCALLVVTFGMHNLEFAKLFPILKWGDNAQSNYMSTACSDAARSYRANVRRVHSLGLIPGHAFLDGEGWKDACNKTESEMPGVDPNSEPFSSRAGKLFNDWWRASDQPEKERHFKEATGNADAMWSRTSLMNEALHGLLQTIIIQAWSTFELLAEDLYKNVIRCGFSSVSSYTDKERKQNRLGFRSRERIRKTYAFIFKIDNSNIKSILSSNFIDALALVRNVLVHTGGIIDDDFLTGAKTIPQLSDFYNLGIGKEIFLTGGWIRALVDPPIAIGFELLNSVDDWLFAHP